MSICDNLEAYKGLGHHTENNTMTTDNLPPSETERVPPISTSGLRRTKSAQCTLPASVSLTTECRAKPKLWSCGGHSLGLKPAVCSVSQARERRHMLSSIRDFLPAPAVLEGPCSAGWTHPVEHGQHHVQLLFLLFLGHVPRRMAQLAEEAAEVHQAQGVVLRTALLLPRPPHDPLHHVHLGWWVKHASVSAGTC